MIYEKDNVLIEALEHIIAVKYEGQGINGDYLNYWALLDENVIRISTASFRTGLKNFYASMKAHPDARDIMGYHFRLMTTLINNNAVIMASDEMYSVLAHSLRNEIDNEVVFDLLASNDELHELTGFEKVLLILHIYQDRIDCAISAFLTPSQKSNTGKERKFKV